MADEDKSRSNQFARQVQTCVGPLWVDPRDRSLGKTLVKRGEYEPEWTAWVRRTIRPGMRVIDVGANLGYYTVLFARQVGEGGRVIAFEPDPNNRDLLERNLQANGLEGLVTVEAKAVADHIGTRRLHIDRNHRGLHSLSPRNRVSGLEQDAIEVPVTTLDTLRAHGTFGSPDFIKVDAQGAEGAILEGGRDTLRDSRPLTLMLELWPFGLTNCGSSLDAVLGLLEVCGFSGARLKKDRVDPVPCAWDDIRRRAERLSGDHASLNLLFSK